MLARLKKTVKENNHSLQQEVVIFLAHGVEHLKLEEGLKCRFPLTVYRDAVEGIYCAAV